MIGTLYAAYVRRRREYYAARPHLRLRLRHPVVSVGNLAVGGRGKTPVVACLARMLLDLGERPAILSRGYARRRAEDGVVVVRDPDGIRADLDLAGDEPLMLARQLHGVSVMVSPNRYLAGRLAELRFGATVHILDDGFQHLQLDRDLDVVIVNGEDLGPEARMLPSGRLREPPDTLLAADAVLAADSHTYFADWPAPVFGLRRTVGPPRTGEARLAEPVPCVAVAGIAGPDRFFDDLRASRWTPLQTLPFRDHHAFSGHDVTRIFDAARAAGAEIVVTTEKDYVRLLPFRPFPLPVAWVPLTMEPDPLPEFRSWLEGGLRATRDIAS